MKQSMPAKTNKELAFLLELFVATDWGERFAELIDEHVKLPKKGKALYVASGTGGHAIALQSRGGESLNVVCVDENRESLELARAKTKTAGSFITEFREEAVDRLTFADDEFAVVIGDGSLIHSERVPEMFAEMVRVANRAAPSRLPCPPSPALESSSQFTGKRCTTSA